MWQRGKKEGRDTDSAGKLIGPWAVSRLGPKLCPAAPFYFFLILSFSLFYFCLKPFGKLSKLIQNETKIL
jgi:hypothetical protein